MALERMARKSWRRRSAIGVRTRLVPMPTRTSGVALGPHAACRSSTCRPAGAQPMRSASGRYTHQLQRRALRLPGAAGSELEPERVPAFRGDSDTEVLLAAIERWGLEGALARAQRHVGLRALGRAVARARPWSATASARSRSTTHSSVRAPPDLRVRAEAALRAHPGVRVRRWTGTRSASWFEYSYVPAPHSIYRGVQKLPPGSLLRVAIDQGGDAEPCPRRTRWWSLEEVADAGCAGALSRAPPRKAVEALSRRCSRTRSRDRMIADVPLGGLLSGGIDSAVVVALMQARARAAREDLHDRLRGSQPRRVGSDAARVAVPPGHGPPDPGGDAPDDAIGADPGAARACTTSPSRIRPRSRPLWSAGWRAAT